MNAASALRAAWWAWKPARAVRLERFELEARAAMRDWLMV